MSETEKSTRTRAPNFTHDEQSLFISCIGPYMNIIESKKNEGITQSVRNETWAKITQTYNENTNGVQRTVENLMNFYRNWKSKLRKEHSDIQQGEPDATHMNGHDWELDSSIVEQPINKKVKLTKVEGSGAKIEKCKLKNNPLVNVKNEQSPESDISDEESIEENNSSHKLVKKKLELLRLKRKHLLMEIQQRKKMYELEYKLKLKELELVELKIKNESS